MHALNDISHSACQVPRHVTRAWSYAPAALRGRRWEPCTLHVGRQETKDVTSLASSTMNREAQALFEASDSQEPSEWKALEVEAFSTVKRNLLEHGLPLMLRTDEDFTEPGSLETG